MVKTGAGLAKWAADAAADGKHVYCYGTYMNPFTARKLKEKAKQYPDHYTSDRMATYERFVEEGKIASDCVGVIKGYLWDENGVIKYERDGIPDVSASGMYKLCKEFGKIADRADELPAGALVFISSKHHVGVYIGGGRVAEARSFAMGFQINNLKDRDFTHWGLCPFVTYDEQTAPALGADDVPTVRKGSEGLAVRIAQRLLVSKGFTLPKWGVDGEFGSETENRVKEFQLNHNLRCDGVVGYATWDKLTR